MIKFEIFDFHICFGCIYFFLFIFFFCGNSKILAFFGEGGGEVILKFKPKIIGKYIVILGVVQYDFISTCM